jgi:heparosan-N-sulfate-glucuronate 5-epimerase
MRSKVVRAGTIDSAGVPLLRGAGGEQFYHPTIVCQTALGYYDRWFTVRRPEDKESFLNLSQWLESTQDSQGGWTCFRIRKTSFHNGHPLGVPGEWTSATSPYSGMTQGQAISVLVRASLIGKSTTPLSTAHRAFTLLKTPISEGGVVSFSGGRTVIEEAAGTPPSGILNGWIFGVFGVWDYWLRTESPRALSFFESNYSSLLHVLPRYDLGWWSLYDAAGHVSKPFYHRLHVSQLEALDRARPHSLLRETIGRWNQASTRLNASKARIAYVMQLTTRGIGTGPFRIRTSQHPQGPP